MALSDNIWWTRKARIQTEKRLLSNAFQSQLLLLWYSFFGVLASIYYLKFYEAVHTDLADVSWVSYSVLVLVMSGFITGLSFKERASLVKECYETLQQLYQEAKQSNGQTQAIVEKYQEVLGLCENHTEIDYYHALCIEQITNTSSKDQKTGIKEDLDRRPSAYHWFSVIIWKTKRSILFTVLYFLPITLFFLLERLSEGS